MHAVRPHRYLRGGRDRALPARYRAEQERTTVSRTSYLDNFRFEALTPSRNFPLNQARRECEAARNRDRRRHRGMEFRLLVKTVLEYKPILRTAFGEARVGVVQTVATIRGNRFAGILHRV